MVRTKVRLLAACGLAVLLVVGCWSSAFGDSPKAVITGPKDAPPGELIVLDATQSSGVVDNGYLWLLVNSEKSFLAVDKGLKCVFSTGTPGDYWFVLVVAGTNPNGGPAADKASHKLRIVGEGPNPTPPVPVPGKITGAILLYESEDSTQELASLILRLRREKITRLRIADKDAKTSDSEEPVEQVQRAVKFLGNKPLPRVLAVDESGSFVADSDCGSYDDVQRLLKSWGL